MRSKKQTVISMLLVLLVLSPIFSSKLASTDDGKMYLLKDDNSYEEFVPETYDEDMGYEVNDKSAINFLGRSWDIATLTALGNYLPSPGFGPGSYTSGEYYLLELKQDSPAGLRWNVGEHKIPIIKLDDGTEVKGTNERIQSVASSSAKGWYRAPYRNRVMNKTLTYSVLYEIPAGKTPMSVIFTDKDGSTTSAKLGSYKSL
jgi:hypothetical protein